MLHLKLILFFFFFCFFIFIILFNTHTNSTICRKFTLDQLLRLCQLEKVKVNMEDNASAERVFEILVEAVVRALKDNGIRSFTNLLTLPLLQAMAARDEPDELNKAKKPVLQKRIREMSLQMGVSKYLQSLNLPIPTLAEIIPLLSGGAFFCQNSFLLFFETNKNKINKYRNLYI